MNVPPQALLTIGLNMVPLIGVFLWGWSSFDLIFLYWLENLVIGVFAVLKMSLRNYDHKLDRTLVLFLVPFFLVHYGFFCYGHGTFVVSSFGDFASRANPFVVALDVLGSTEMRIALAALVGVQLVGWVQDILRNGFGGGAIFAHTVDPYRRIIILHLTLFVGGFLMSVMGDPAFGLLGLVLVKTMFDWRQVATSRGTDEPVEISEALLAKVMASQTATNPKHTAWQEDPYARQRIAEEVASMISMAKKLSPRGSKNLDALLARERQPE